MLPSQLGTCSTGARKSKFKRAFALSEQEQGQAAVVAAGGASHLSSPVLVGAAGLSGAKCRLLSSRCLREASQLCCVLRCLLNRPAMHGLFVILLFKYYPP